MEMDGSGGGKTGFLHEDRNPLIQVRPLELKFSGDTTDSNFESSRPDKRVSLRGSKIRAHEESTRRNSFKS